MSRSKSLTCRLRHSVAALFLLTLTLWILSRWFIFGLILTPSLQIAVNDAMLRITTQTTMHHLPPRHAYLLLQKYPEFEWRYYLLRTPAGTEIGLPLWYFPAFFLACSLWAYRPRLSLLRNRRGPACPNCRYDLAGIPRTDPCPECGCRRR